jgi:hypothetical protein
MATPPDPRTLPNNPARGWVAIVPDDDPSIYIGFDTTLSEAHGSEVEATDHAVEQGTDITDNIRPKPTIFGCVVYVSNTPVIPASQGLELGDPSILHAGSTPANTPGYPAVNDIPIPFPAQALAQPPGAPLFTPGGIFQAAAKGIGAALDAIGLGGSPQVTQFSPVQFVGVFDAVKNTLEALLKLQTSGSTCTVFTSIREYEDMVLTKVMLPRDHFGGGEVTLEFKHINFVETATVPAPKPTVPQGQPVQKKGDQAPAPAKAPPPPPAADPKTVNEKLGGQEGSSTTGDLNSETITTEDPLPDGYGGQAGTAQKSTARTTDNAQGHGGGFGS